MQITFNNLDCKERKDVSYDFLLFIVIIVVAVVPLSFLFLLLLSRILAREESGKDSEKFLSSVRDSSTGDLMKLKSFCDAHR